MTSPYLSASTPLAFAHRGGAGHQANLGIENSLSAFQHAVGLGYRYVETDVRATRDGVVYACHDADLSRLGGDRTPIAELTSQELDEQLVGGREPVVRLDRLLAELPGTRINIDVKSDDVVLPTCTTLLAAGAVDRVCIASFSSRRLRRVRALLPHVATSAGPAEVAAVRLGLGRPKAPVAYQVPAVHRGIQVVVPAFVRRAHALGAQVHVWTIDDPAEMHRLLDLGVDGIVSDRTDLLKDVLIARGQWQDAP